MAKPYRSAQKLRRDNCLSEITSNAALKTQVLANLGIAGSGANLDGSFAIENTSDVTKKIVFSAAGNTTAKTATIASAVTLDRTITLPNASVTLASLTGTEELTAKTVTAQVVKTGLTASGSAANDFSASTGAFLTSSGANTISGAATMAATKALTLAAGAATAGQGPLYFGAAGTLLTAAAAGAVENDAVASYVTNEVTSGRGFVPVKQYFFLTAAGSAISTIANFFGTTSNISLVANAFYDIDIFAWFTNSADTNTMTWTLTNSAAPTSQNIYFEMSPAAGIVAPPGTATTLAGQYLNDATAARAFNSAALGSAATYYARFKIFLKNGSGTNLKIQATKNTAGTVTPALGSYWQCTRLPAANTGAFAA